MYRGPREREKDKGRQLTPSSMKQRIACKPRGLSHVSHSPNRLTDSPSSLNTTTLLRRATANQPRLQDRPRTFSRNSNSATSFPSTSSQSTTLLGGYSGLRPPPIRKSKEDVWRGITADRVPPGSSKDGYPGCISPELNGGGVEPSGPTSFTQQLEWPCLINCEACRGSRGEDATIRIVVCVKDLDWAR